MKIFSKEKSKDIFIFIIFLLMALWGIWEYVSPKHYVPAIMALVLLCSVIHIVWVKVAFNKSINEFTEVSKLHQDFQEVKKLEDGPEKEQKIKEIQDKALKFEKQG